MADKDFASTSLNVDFFDESFNYDGTTGDKMAELADFGEVRVWNVLDASNESIDKLVRLIETDCAKMDVERRAIFDADVQRVRDVMNAYEQPGYVFIWATTDDFSNFAIVFMDKQSIIIEEFLAQQYEGLFK